MGKFTIELTADEAAALVAACQLAADTAEITNVHRPDPELERRIRVYKQLTRDFFNGYMKSRKASA